MHCVDLGESFPTHILLQNLASIQLRTSPFKFARSPRTDPPGEPADADYHERRGYPVKAFSGTEAAGGVIRTVGREAKPFPLVKEG